LSSKKRRKGPILQKGVNLYVKNLADEIDDDKLKQMFEQFGKITSAKIMTDANGKSKNFGFVCFRTPESAARALHGMHGRVEHGKSLCVFKAQKKEQRRAFLARKRNQYRQQIFWPYGGPSQQHPSQRVPPMGVPPNNLVGGPYGPNVQGVPSGPPAGPWGFPQSVTNINPNQLNPNQLNAMNASQLGNPMSGNPNFVNQNLRGGPMGNPQGLQGGPQGINPYPQNINQQLAALNPQQRALYMQQMQAQQQGLNPMGSNNPNLGPMGMGGGGGGPQGNPMGVNRNLPGPIGFVPNPQSNPQNIPQFPNQQQIQRPPPFGNSSQQNVAIPPQNYGRQGSQTGSFQPNVSSAQNVAPQMTGTAPSGPNTSVQQHSVSAVSGANVHHSASMQETQPLTSAMLQNAKPEERKRFIGERLFPKIQAVEPRRAGKITGMLLEMDDTELLVLLHDNNALFNKINEALAVLKDHQIKQSAQNPSQQNASQQNASQLNNPRLSASNQQTSQSQTHQT